MVVVLPWVPATAERLASGQCREQVGATQHGDPPFAGGDHLGVVVRDRGGDGHQLDVADVTCVVADVDLDAQRAQPLERRAVGLVGARDRVPLLGEHGGDGRHAGAPDGDDVDASWHVQRRRRHVGGHDGRDAFDSTRSATSLAASG